MGIQMLIEQLLPFLSPHTYAHLHTPKNAKSNLPAFQTPPQHHAIHTTCMHSEKCTKQKTTTSFFCLVLFLFLPCVVVHGSPFDLSVATLSGLFSGLPSSRTKNNNQPWTNKSPSNNNKTKTFFPSNKNFAFRILHPGYLTLFHTPPTTVLTKKKLFTKSNPPPTSSKINTQKEGTCTTHKKTHCHHQTRNHQGAKFFHPPHNQQPTTNNQQPRAQPQTHEKILHHTPHQNIKISLQAHTPQKPQNHTCTKKIPST